MATRKPSNHEVQRILDDAIRFLVEARSRIKVPSGSADPLVDDAAMRHWIPSWRHAQIDEFLAFGRVVARAQSKLKPPRRR